MNTTRIFPWEDRKLLIVHLASFDWDFSLGKRVKLVQGDTQILAKQVGAGNHEGHATLTLTLLVDWDDAIQALRGMEATRNPIEIEIDESSS